MLAGCLSRPVEDVMVEQARYVLSLKEKLSAEEKARLAGFEATMASGKKLTEAEASSSTPLAGEAAGLLAELAPPRLAGHRQRTKAATAHPARRAGLPDRSSGFRALEIGRAHV